MADSIRTFLSISGMLGMISLGFAQQQRINEKVIQFCKDHRGKQVGGGQCTDLAEAALKHADAKPRTAFKDNPGQGDYVWGELVYALEMKDDTRKESKDPKRTIQPGDVIQYRDATFKGKDLRGFENYEAACPHHTAVVLEVMKAPNVLAVLEQNVDGRRIVAESSYRLTDLKTGWLRIYRPVPK
jgi:hypothetical protein